MVAMQYIALQIRKILQCNLELKRNEWQLLEKVVKVLKPLEEASKQKCRADEPISIQLPIARALHDHDLKEPELEQMCEAILHLLFETFDIEDQKIYGLSMFLGPRIKNRLANNKILLNSDVVSWIQEECEKQVEVPASNSGIII